MKKHLNEKYQFDANLVGSATRGMIIKDSNGMYDLDYQIILEGVSQDNAQSIHYDFSNAFKSAITKNQHAYNKVEDSTSAITVKCSNHSLDFVILRKKTNHTEIVRRSDQNKYSWNILSSKHDDVYKKFNQLSDKEKEELAERVIKRKCKAKMRGAGELSYVIFVEEVNKYVP